MPKKSIAIDLGALGLRFESLGNGCEFGLFQRCCGVEPLGLLRFASARLSSLTDGLANGFLDYGAPEDLLLAYEEGEYMCRSRRYDDFRYHTNVVDEVVDLDRLLARESRKIGFLKERLLSDLAAGEKIMVRTGDDPIDGVIDLAAILRRAGTSSLLWVTEADDLHPPGHVELIGPGLVRGRVRKYARYAPALRIDLDSWRRICIQTLGLIAAGGTRSDHHVVRGQTLCRGHGFEPQGFVELAEAPVTDHPAGVAPATRIRFRHPTGLTRMLVRPAGTIKVKGVSHLTFSAWVRLSSQFGTGRIRLLFDDQAPLYCNEADLSLRDVWQRIWVSVKGPVAAKDVRVGLFGAGQPGETIDIAAWEMLQGPMPAEWCDSGYPSWAGRWSSARRRADIVVGEAVRALRNRAAQAMNRCAESVAAHHPADLRLSTSPGGLAWRTFFEAGRRLTAMRRFDEADDVYAQALAAFPGDRGLLIARALAANASGFYERAADAWIAAREVAPDDPLCHCGVAANFREMGRIALAVKAIEVAAIRFPNDCGVFAERARVAEAEGDFVSAERCWDCIAGKGTPHPDWLQGHATALLLTRRFDEAAAVLERGRAVHRSHRGLATVQDLLATVRAGGDEQAFPAAAYPRPLGSGRPDHPNALTLADVARLDGGGSSR